MPKSRPTNEPGRYLEMLDRPALLLRSDRTILAVNRALESALVKTGASSVGRSCHEALHGRRRPCAEDGIPCPLDRCRSTGESCRSVHVHACERGAEHVAVRIRPLDAPGSPEARYVGIVERVPFVHASASPAGLVGRSPEFEAVVDRLHRVAASDTPVLLVGETGTGREMAARTIHAFHPGADRPFVVADGSGLDVGTMAASADAGTLFVRDVDEVPVREQARLLRALEAETPFRFLASTTRRLDALVEEGRFRRELLLRIGVYPIELPPLRDRTGDLPLLAEALLLRAGLRRGRRHAIHAAALALLARYEFPGNVRELDAIVQTACDLADDGVILPDHLPERCRGGAEPEALGFRGGVLPLEEAERRYIAWAVSRSGGRRDEAARGLGISPRTLARKLSGGGSRRR